MKYYEGLGKTEKVTFYISEQEAKRMVEKDYHLRLAEADGTEIVLKRTAQEIFDEVNRQERNSWEKHHRHLTFLHTKETSIHALGDHTLEMVADNSQLEKLKQQADYEALCQKIYKLLKPEQADMMIAICLDGLAVKDYAAKIGEKPNNVSKGFNRAKRILRKSKIKK